MLKVRSFIPSFLRHAPPKPPAAAPPKAETSSVVKIIHAGGNVEYYYMAVPAIRIMEKYPSFLLARPEIFRRPWDSLVRSDEILTPGQKFFLVPHRTVRKLRRGFREPTRETSMDSSSWQSSDDISDSDNSVSQQNRDEIFSEISQRSIIKSSGKEIVTHRRVRFSSTVSTRRKALPSPASTVSSWRKALPSPAKVSTIAPTRKSMPAPAKVSIIAPSPAEAVKEKSSIDVGNRTAIVGSQRLGRKKKAQNMVLWQPTLTAISESSPARAAKN